MAARPQPTPDDDDELYGELSPAVRDAIDRKVAAYSSRRSNAKTPAQYKIGLISQALDRYADLPARLSDGGTIEAIEDIVLRLVGRTDVHYHNAIHMFNIREHMDSEKRREIAEAVAQVESRNNAKLHEHISTLTGALVNISNNMGLPPPPAPPAALPPAAAAPPPPPPSSRDDDQPEQPPHEPDSTHE